jgi:transglutaminase-like putative cysteine protease
VNHRFTITAAIASAAASVALLPLVSGGKWFFGGLGGIIVIALVGTATRHRAVRALPAVVCLLCALVALALYLNLIYAASYSYIHLIPSPRSLSYLWNHAVSALRATHSQTPPVPATVGIELVSDAGIGLVAALTDLLAVRLRRCALAGLPLLVLFSVPVATGSHGNTTENTIVFCVGIAGYLALLSTDGRERLRLWGRLVTPWNASRPDEPAEELGAGPSLRALAASGRRIGLAAIVLALVTPVFIPGLHPQRLFPGGGNDKGNGYTQGNGGNPGDLSVNPLTSMTGDLRQNSTQDLFTYTTTDQHPQYLVEEVLGQLTYDGATRAPHLGQAEPVSAGKIFPPVPGLTSGDWPTVYTKVRMVAAQTLEDGYLPVPYAPRQIVTSRPTTAVVPSTLMVASSLASLKNLTYTVASQDVFPTQAQFEAATAAPSGMGYYLEVPRPLTSLASLATRITAGATTPYEKARALVKWFTSPGRFTYDTSVKLPDSPHALQEFLTTSRTGFCQQFSFAMTVLSRLLGIPARVAVGFDQGTSTGPHAYRVDGSDAHAWTQLYFTGLGWTTWDATPSGNGVGQSALIPPTYTVAQPPGSNASGHNGATTGRQTSADGRRENQRRFEGLLDGGGTGTYTPPVKPKAPGSSSPIALMALAALLVVGVVSPRVVRTVTRRRRWRGARDNASLAHAAWAELMDNLTDYGITHGPGETPRALARRLSAQQHLDSHTREALGRLAQAEERASYAREAAAAGPLPKDVTTVRAAVSAAQGSRARWRARLMPQSAVEEIRRFLVHVLDAFDWFAVITARLKTHLPHLRPDQS